MKLLSHFRQYPLFGSSSLNAQTPAKSVCQPLLIWVAAAGLFVSSQAAAQDFALLTNAPKPSAKPLAAPKGFWKMTTAPGADSTLVGFYTPENTLLHAETLPNRALKLTKRHLQKLNEMTDQLMTANAASVSPNALAESLSGQASREAGPLKMGMYASRDGIHLHVMLDNPGSNYVSIELRGKDGHAVYQTSTRLTRPHYKLNLDGMPAGDYHLRVLGKKQSFERDLSFGYPKPDPSLPTMQIAVK